MTAPALIFVYIPCASADEAKKIGRTLVEEKLAACVNIFNGLHSIYRWEGKLETAEETLLLVKTRPDLFAPLAARVKTLHSYKLPCIAALPVEQVEAAYASWIRAETKAQ